MTTPRTRPQPRRLARTAGVALALGISATGCTSLFELAEEPFKAAAHALEPKHTPGRVDPIVLQGELMRFSDSFHSMIIQAAGQLRRSGKPPDPLKLLGVELHFSQNVLAAATGPNALANLLDMIVIVTLTRISVEDYWMPKAFGESAKPLLDACLLQEREIWKIASTILTAKEQSELRRAIGTWHDRNPSHAALEDLRVSGFISEIARYGRNASPESNQSVFDLLQIDPLASLDPAAREIAETRYFGERALFLVQRMPTLLRWQTEVLTTTVARMPEVTQALADTQRLSDSAAQLSQLATQLPAIVDTQRKLLLSGFETSSTRLSTLVEKTQSALNAGNAMAQSTTAALKTFEDVQHAFASNQSGSNNSAPVSIDTYTALATQIGTTASQINATLTSLEQLSGELESGPTQRRLISLGNDLEQRGDRLIGQLMRTGLLLILAACIGLVLSLLAYRLICDRWLRRQS